MIKKDPTIEEIREARKKISEKYNNNPQQIVNYYMELQKKYQDRHIKVDEEENKSVINAS